jgi:hypothetical protein|tara:strand:- start:5860 stop:6048 length:189 start_codon:yes stop_codon:yes gene_type:complete
MATKTADKYKLIVNLAEYFDDITRAGVSSAVAKDMADGKPITKAQCGKLFDYMLKNKLIEKE